MSDDARAELARADLSYRDIQFGVYVFTPSGIFDVTRDVLRGNFTIVASPDGASFSIDLVYRETYSILFTPNTWVGISERYDAERSSEIAAPTAGVEDRWAFIGMIAEPNKNRDTEADQGTRSYINIQGEGWYRALRNVMLWVPWSSALATTALELLSVVHFFGSPRYLLASLIYGWIGTEKSVAPLVTPQTTKIIDLAADLYRTSDTLVSTLPVRPNMDILADPNFFKLVCWDDMYTSDVPGYLWNSEIASAMGFQQPGTTLLDLMARLAVLELNELWFDVDESPTTGKQKLVMRLRQKPYSRGDWGKIRTHNIWDVSLKAEEFGTNDADIINFSLFTYQGTDFVKNMVVAMVETIKIKDPATGAVYSPPFKEEVSINKNGLRPNMQDLPFGYAGNEIGSKAQFDDSNAYQKFTDAHNAFATTVADSTADYDNYETARAAIAKQANDVRAKRKGNPTQEILQKYADSAMGQNETSEIMDEWTILTGLSWLNFTWYRYADMYRSGTITVPYRFERPGRKTIIAVGTDRTALYEFYTQSVTVYFGREQPTMANIGLTRGLPITINRWGNLYEEMKKYGETVMQEEMTGRGPGR